MEDKKDIDKIVNFCFPRFNELPHVALYKDQVIIYVEEQLKYLRLEPNEKLLTPTMINNYVKQKVVSPPKDKKYDEEHLAYFIVVCVLKQIFTLSEVSELIKIQIETCSVEKGYNLFVTELENYIKSVFITRDFSGSCSENNTTKRELMKSAIISFVNKLFVQKYLHDNNGKNI